RRLLKLGLSVAGRPGGALRAHNRQRIRMGAPPQIAVGAPRRPALRKMWQNQRPPPLAGPGTPWCGVETQRSHAPQRSWVADTSQVGPPRPFVPGQEIAGTVVSAMANSGLAEGDRIASKVEWGGFAEYAVVRGDMAMRLPGGMSINHAAALPVVYTTALVAMT